MRLFSFRLNILTSCLFHLSDDQLLHFPSLLLLPFSSTYIILYILYLLITSYNYKTVLLTYFLHTFCIVLNNLHLSNLLRSRAIVCWRQSVDRARPCWRTRLHGHDTVAISGWLFSKWATKKNLQHPTELWKKKRFNLQAPPVNDRKVTNLFFFHNYFFHNYFFSIILSVTVCPSIRNLSAF